MKKSITNIIAGLMLAATISIVLTNCSKQQNAEFNKSLIDAQAATDLKEADAVQNPGCGATVPAILTVPEGNKLAHQAYATGVQIFEVRRSATDPNSFSWVNIAPSANLYLLPDFSQQVGTHYGGPSWEFTKGFYKGEKTVATKLQGVTVDATAAQWLLLKAVDALSSPGNKVTYIQRVCTTGGLAPATVPNESNLGQQERISYTATYLFYEKKN